MLAKEISCIRHQGFSLVELMVGLAIGLLVMLAAFGVYFINMRSAYEILGLAQINAEIRGAMDVIAADLRRAGYGGPQFSEPGGYALVVREDGLCILFSYDRDHNGVLKAVASDKGETYELFGFKVEDGTIKVRKGGGDFTNCDTGNGQWESLTDPATVIVDAPSDDEAHFEISYQCIRSDNNDIGDDQRCMPSYELYDEATLEIKGTGINIGLVETRRVTLNFPAYLEMDSEIRIALRRSVFVRNHRLVVVTN